MKKNGFVCKAAAGVLAALMLTQSASLTAFAAAYTEIPAVQAEVRVEPVLQNGTAIIPENADLATVKEALCEALVANADEVDAQSLEWEYKCEGELSTGLVWGNESWGSIEGFTSTKKVMFVTATYNHPSLGDNGEGSYPVRLAGTDTEVTLKRVYKLDSSYTLKDDPYEVGMVYAADGSYDYAATAAALYEAVVASTEPALTADDVKVEFSKSGISYQPLDEKNLGVSFGTGNWKIKLSWDGNDQYKGWSATVDVTTTDSRAASGVVLKEGASFTYDMDAGVMEQAIFDSVIDWENSNLPAKETLTPDNFVMEYYGEAVLFDGGVDSGIQNWAPVEGKSYDLGSLNLGAYPQMGAGDQQIRVKFSGSADYRPSESAEGAVTVEKAKVSVKVHSTNLYVNETLPADFITTDPADTFDVYTIYAGVTSNVTTALYLDLPDRYTDSAFLKLLDPVVEAIYGKSFRQMLNDGMTVGELRALLSTQELLDLLDKLNIDTGTFGQVLTVINNLPSVMDSVSVSFGVPTNRAGLYTVAAVTDNQNYETGVGMGFLLVKMRLSGAQLTWNQEIEGGKLTAAEAQSFDFGVTLSYNGDPSVDQSSVHYLYSGLTSKWRVYSSTTTPPTEPGSYVVTVVTLGGNYLPAPITRSFQITK